MARIKICKEAGCHNSQTTGGYCRLHYLKHWKQIKAAAGEKAAKKLNRYVDYMAKKNPERYIEDIKKDLRQRRFDPGFAAADTEDGAEPDLVDRLFGVDETNELEEILKELKIEKDF